MIFSIKQTKKLKVELNKVYFFGELICTIHHTSNEFENLEFKTLKFSDIALLSKFANPSATEPRCLGIAICDDMIISCDGSVGGYTKFSNSFGIRTMIHIALFNILKDLKPINIGVFVNPKNELIIKCNEWIIVSNNFYNEILLGIITDNKNYTELKTNPNALLKELKNYDEKYFKLNNYIFYTKTLIKFLTDYKNVCEITLQFSPIFESCKLTCEYKNNFRLLMGVIRE